MNKVILWDFDGTLGYREGNWEETIFELADKTIKTKAIVDLVSEKLQTGFPWHEPQTSFVAINNSQDWWDFVKPKFIEIFATLGYDRRETMLKAAQVSEQYGKFEKWKLYDDTIPCLIELRNNNWISVLVTNNIPEFPTIMKYLNFEEYFDAVFVSSLIGFNKPNPSILNGYLETMQDENKIIIVGDRESDLAFAQAVLAEGILVRSTASNLSLNFDDLNDLTTHLLSLNF